MPLSKSGESATAPRVRIPLSPPNKKSPHTVGSFYLARDGMRTGLPVADPGPEALRLPVASLGSTRSGEANPSLSANQPAPINQNEDINSRAAGVVVSIFVKKLTSYAHLILFGYIHYLLLSVMKM